MKNPRAIAISLLFLLTTLFPLTRKSGAVHETVSIEARGTSSCSSVSVGPNRNVSKRPNGDSEATVAVNPNNTNNVVIVSNIEESGGLFKAFTTDGGSTWTTTIIANGDSLGSACCDPSLSGCFDNFGNLFLTYIDDVAPRKVQAAISTDGGATFSLLSTLATDKPDQPTVVTGAGAVWVTYTQSGSIVARAASVTGLGMVGAFSSPQVAPGSAGMNFSDIAIGPTGQVMVTYQSNGIKKGPNTIFANIDPDGLSPMGFGSQITVTSTNVGARDSIPAQAGANIDAEVGLAWDRSGGLHNGRVYLVYTDETLDENNDTNILVRFSTDNGATWGAPVRANDDSTARSQFLPRIALDQSTGNIGVSWHDCRNDAGNHMSGDTNGIANDDAQFFATFSTDGGASFLTNIQVSTGTSNAAVAGNKIGYGDYTGLAFCGGVAYPAWADNSNSTGDNPNGALSKFDIYTARITGPIPDTQPPLITCPPSVITSAANACPFSGSAIVCYPNPSVADNCPGVTFVCSPPSGAIFPVGTTTVLCTAIDTSSNTSSCMFSVRVFSGCIQDDPDGSRVAYYDHITGAYRICCNGVVVASNNTGSGVIRTIKGCILTIEDHSDPTRSVLIKLDMAARAGTVAVKEPPGNLLCSIIDRNLINNTNCNVCGVGTAACP